MSNRKFLTVSIAVAALLTFGSASHANEQFTLQSAKGIYGFSGSGSLFGVPATVVGLTRFDGMGGCGLTAVLNVAGTVSELNSSACFYVVGPNGMGSSNAVFHGPIPGPFISNFVIVDKKEIHFILSDGFGGGTVATGISRRQPRGED